MLNVRDLTVDAQIIEAIHKKEPVKYVPSDMGINDYAVLHSNADHKSTALAKYLGEGQWSRISRDRDLSMQGLEPRDVNQCAFVDCLLNKKILVNVAVGTAGTGKTTLALAYAAQQYLSEDKPIFLSKPTAMVGMGKAFGPVPGDIGEKYAPYLASYDIVLKKLFGEKSKDYLSAMKNRGHLEFVPIELARGCTYENCTFILDEAQNLDWHEVNTIVSRMGENTKLIILGDLKQIDVGMRERETGMHKLIHARPFQQSSITSVVELTTQYRSPITKLVAEVNEWVINGKNRSSRENSTNIEHLRG